MSNCDCPACRAMNKVNETPMRSELMESGDHDDARAHLDRARIEIEMALELFDGITHPVVCVAEGNIGAAAGALDAAIDLLEMGA